MRMETMIVCVVLLCALNSFASVWDKMTAEEKREAFWALDHGAEFDIRLRVVDDEGTSVENAKCSGWAYLEHDPNHGKGYAAQTDADGVVRVSGKCGEWVSVVLSKEGYYQTTLDMKYPLDCVPAVADGKWQPYGETRTVTLKRIINPIRLRNPDAKCCHRYPESGEWAGFDLQVGDWVPPLGDGKCSDMMVRYTREARADGYFKSLDVSFANSPYAGVYLMNKDSYSVMDSVYSALTNGEYVSTLRYEFERTSKGNHMISELGSGQYLVFRVRPKVDRDGRLVSAHYGRIMGDWRFVEKGGMLLGPIFFNPTPNDTNLEDAETARKSRLGYKQMLEFEKQRRTEGK